MFHLAEECPGCGVIFEAAPELANVDFSGEQFEVKRQEFED